MNEIWKDIEGYEGIYQVSSLGRVRSLPRVVYIRHQSGKVWPREEKGIIMAQKLQNTDRLQVCLRKVVDGKRHRRTFYVHRLVAVAFVPNPDNKSTVNHINEDHHDNRAENLEWMTKKENNQYGTHSERCGKALRMSVEQLTADGKHIAYFDSISQAATETGCPISSIHRCCRGEQENTKGYKWRYNTTFRKLLKERNHV